MAWLPSIQTLSRPVAPVWHTCCMVLLLVASTARGIYLHTGSTTSRVSHVSAYLTIFASEWLLFGFSLLHSDPAFRGYVKQATHRPRLLLWDIPVATALCCVLLFVVNPLIVHLLPGPGWDSQVGIAPEGTGETALWLLVAISAGISEETVFRGYFQQQFAVWTGSQLVGLLAQALLFGLCHIYQGWRKTILISVWGFVFGLFVSWRKGLRANMIGHAVLDSLVAFR